MFLTSIRLSEYYFWVSQFEKINVFLSKMVYVCFIGRFDSRAKQQDALRHFRTFFVRKYLFSSLFFKNWMLFLTNILRKNTHKNTAHTEPGGEPRFQGWCFFCFRLSRKHVGGAASSTAPLPPSCTSKGLWCFPPLLPLWVVLFLLPLGGGAPALFYFFFFKKKKEM